MNKKIIFAVISIFMLIFTACSNKEETYPKKAITVLVPYGAGGTTDILAREISALLKDELGVPVNVVNKPGASGSVGNREAFEAKSDGYTLLFTADSIVSNKVLGISDINYENFTPLSLVSDDPKVIVSKKGGKYRDARELFDDIKKRSSQVKMSNTGRGGSGHVQELIYNKYGYNLSSTPFNSGLECVVAVISDQVDFTNANLSTAKKYIDSNELELLAICSNHRLDRYKDVPALSEIIPQMKEDLDTHFTPLSIMIKKDVDEQIKNLLKEAIDKVLNSQEISEFVSENSIVTLFDKYKTQEEMNGFYSGLEKRLKDLFGSN